MSELIKHECGIALIRLRKPLSYYQQKYGTWRYGINKIYLLMEKQHNRGQDGAGLVNLKIDVSHGRKYFNRVRSIASAPLQDIFSQIKKDFQKIEEKNHHLFEDSIWAKENVPFAGEVYLGHLRYGTFGGNGIENVHPVMRENNWKSRNLVLAGNFNLTNVDELYNSLLTLGQHPKDYSDTVTILENVGHFLDDENQGLFDLYKKRDYSNKEISPLIEKNLDITNILKASSKRWDGGYVIGGLIGHGDSFVMRDPWGIRPAFYYYDDEVIVVASERPVIQTSFNLREEQVRPIPPGAAMVIKKDGQFSIEQIREAETIRSCSFERIYFSRGSDVDIYTERKKLGELLTPQILESINYDLDNTVFSYIPNTAESAFYGMIKGVEDYVKLKQVDKIWEKKDNLSKEDLLSIIARRPRVEKVAIKDIKMRTFISQDNTRDDLVAHVYDITYGSLRRNVDNLVIIDDSIVRGTTLEKSILRILDRLDPKKIVIVSSSPQIRYPDCYGIDMAVLGDFIAFKAVIQLLKDEGKEHILEETYQKCKAELILPKEKAINHVKDIYKDYTPEQISKKISQMLKTKFINAEVEIVYQTVENLHIACPNDLGDWYFTGNYPTPGGNKVVNQAFVNFIEGVGGRAY
jgi:amidophosphoribosyltransferase